MAARGRCAATARCTRWPSARGDKTKELAVIGTTKERGTTVSFKPDTQIFEETTYSFDTLSNRLRELAFLNKGVRISLTDERPASEEGGEVRRDDYHYEGGLRAFVEHLRGTRKPLHADVIYIEAARPEAEIEIALQYDDGYNENTFTFVNNINTHEGGTHLTGFKAALTRSINDYARKTGLFKKGGLDALSGDDVREGLTAVISVKVREPQFEGQTKTKLGNSEVKGAVETVVNQKLSEFLDETPGVGRAIIEKAVSAARAREAARKARDLTRKKSALETGVLPGKLADCSSQQPRAHRAVHRRGRQRRRQRQAGAQARVPGDPAAQGQDPERGKGALRQGAEQRGDPRHHHRHRHGDRRGRVQPGQRALPQGHHHDRRGRGRQPHPHAAAHLLLPADAAAAGRGVHLHRAAAAVPGQEGQDGALRLQRRRARRDPGRLPRPAADGDGKSERGIHVQRYKGLGEMNPEQLWKTTMDPDVRTLLQVTMEDAVEADGVFTKLMGEEVEPRRQFIEQNARYVRNLDV